MSYLQSVKDAEEITQSVFVTVYVKAGTFKGNAKFSTWLYRITINKSLNLLEKQQRRPQSNEEIRDYHRIDFRHPGVLLENLENSKFLFKAIDSLSENQKTAFILSYVEDLPRQEVADIMQSTLKSVESLLQRAKSNLRKKIINIYPKEKSKNDV